MLRDLGVSIKWSMHIGSSILIVGTDLKERRRSRTIGIFIKASGHLVVVRVEYRVLLAERGIS